MAFRERYIRKPVTANAGEVLSYNSSTDSFEPAVVSTQAGGGAPIGSILMWSLLNGAIPAGWAECNGTANSPGPDLRDRFIVGRSATKAVDTTGGADTHTHDYTDVISHTHAVNVTDPGHSHTQQVMSSASGGQSGVVRDTSSNQATNDARDTASATTGITASTDAPAGSVVTGTTTAASTLPPYYALIFIQRMS